MNWCYYCLGSAEVLMAFCEFGVYSVRLIRRVVIMYLKSAPGMLRICESAGENPCWAIYLPLESQMCRPWVSGMGRSSSMVASLLILE